ncbi:MAG: galactitol-1-phosphate 5-dehydrogenase [Cyclobacteriaceae bacterium]|nr:galactitol-1-phosphate 5-dehydrogenase [Cyclobacteriaceae bacterium]
MKALVLEAYKTLVYKEIEDPRPGSGEVKVRIMATGICGSDVHGYDGTSGRRIPPMVMGHESSGTIEELGPGVTGWKIGDRVTFDSTIYNPDDWFTKRGQYNLSENRRVLGVSCNEYKQDGAFAEYIVIPAHILHRIPDKVSFEAAAMTEPIAVALHAVNLCEADPDEKVMVVGTGIIGLLLIQVLKARGFKDIFAVDVDPGKLELASRIGANKLLNPGIDDIAYTVDRQTEFRRLGCIFEAVGIQETIDISFENIRKGGTLVLVGNITPEVKMPLQKIVTQQLRVQGSCAISGEYPEALQLLEKNKITTDLLISRVAPLSEGASWFERLYTKEKGLLKVILTP